jgi:hypothetical protein
VSLLESLQPCTPHNRILKWDEIPASQEETTRRIVGKADKENKKELTWRDNLRRVRRESGICTQTEDLGPFLEIGTPVTSQTGWRDHPRLHPCRFNTRLSVLYTVSFHPSPSTSILLYFSPVFFYSKGLTYLCLCDPLFQSFRAANTSPRPLRLQPQFRHVAPQRK